MHFLLAGSKPVICGKSWFVLKNKFRPAEPATKKTQKERYLTVIENEFKKKERKFESKGHLLCAPNEWPIKWIFSMGYVLIKWLSDSEITFPISSVLKALHE